MIDVKNNYKGKYQSLLCRGCLTAIETQEHVFEECTKLHMDDSTKINLCEIFSDSTQNKRETVNKIKQIMNVLQKSEVQSAQPGDPGVLA